MHGQLLVPKDWPAPDLARSAGRTPQPPLDRLHVAGPAPLAAYLHDLARLDDRQPLAVQAIDPEPVTVPGVVSDAVEALAAHLAAYAAALGM